MKFEDTYFEKFRFTASQIKRNFDNALKDLNIAKKDKILEVKFNIPSSVRCYIWQLVDTVWTP